ncbi:hypothetical protein GH714_041664 [Hevea brasiliensis]|uniref:Uncharacterized protein n=1 Tax=Hevea brasiliensis TaxID=3981 RepID=A0A6A6MVV5_HEVBR|nr:hypothetical protein GH714_041664 [Hevea brasiliensis]
MLALAAAHARQKQEKDHHGVSLSSVKTDSSALLEWKTKRANNEQSREAERKVLRPQLSKIAITSLEFSEALPFAAFASLLVETVARLDNVIEEVEELGRIACFKEFKPGDEIVETPKVNVSQNHLPYSNGAETEKDNETIDPIINLPRVGGRNAPLFDFDRSGPQLGVDGYSLDSVRAIYNVEMGKFFPEADVSVVAFLEPSDRMLTLFFFTVGSDYDSNSRKTLKTKQWMSTIFIVSKL